MGRVVLVCGGRYFADKIRLSLVLTEMHGKGADGISRIVCGGATGADSLAEEWAKDHGVRVVVHPAKWQTYGRAAGPIRNRQMLEVEKPDLVLAFPGGSGTEDMVHAAKDAGVPVRRV